MKVLSEQDTSVPTVKKQGVPFVDLWRLHEPLLGNLNRVIADTIHHSAFTLSDALAAFEIDFAAYCGTKYAVGVSSGTDALHLALRARHIGPGDEVITVPNTFIATAEAISICGARPVFVDVDETTFNMDVAKLEASITSATKAIIPVHLFGQSADMDAINEIAARHGLLVIEDACQAHGAMYKGQKAGSLSTAGCFSFYPGKNLGAMGDGGMVVTNNKDMAEAIKTLRHHGQSDKNVHSVIGYCNRLDGLQAAILGVKLPHLDEWNDLRIAAAARYDKELEHVDVVAPCSSGHGHHVYHLYVVRSNERDKLREHLAEKGIQTGIHYPIPIHLQPACSHLGYKPGDFPVTEKLEDQILSLPMFPGITDGELETVGSEINRFEAAKERGFNRTSELRGQDPSQ